MRREMISYLKPLPRGFNPFSEGFVGNLKMAFLHRGQLR